MVKLPMLPLKMLRDLWRMRGQALAIALVIAAGLSTWIVALSTMNSLQATMQGFYAEQRFADVFAECVRAPRQVLARIKDIDGVITSSARIVTSGRASIAGFADTITAAVLSIPDEGRPALNDLYLESGRLPSPDRSEAVVSEAFAKAHGLAEGDRLTLVVRGLQFETRISGLAVSPEFIYQIAPGQIFPDHARHVVLWLRERQLAAVTDMRGAFNSVSLRLAADANRDRVIDHLDKILAPYGSRGAYARADQLSHLYLTEELRQLENMARIFPLIFLGVAVFLLAVVIGRQVHQQREEIATLKAFGYSNSQVSFNYLLLELLVVAVGCLLGTLAGARVGNGLGNLYADFFRFPFIRYSLGVDVLASGYLLAALAAVLGTFSSLRRAWSLTPAEAMRPEAPERYARRMIERLGSIRRSHPTSRMILRHLDRRPVKSGLTVIGLAAALAILMVGSFQGDAIDYMIDVQYGLAQREHVAVGFDRALGPDAVLALARLEGVTDHMPFRGSPAHVSFGHRMIKTSIQAFPTSTGVHRAIDSQMQPIQLPREGILLARYHADELGVSTGDTVRVEILDGQRPTFTTEVAGITREFIGSSAYMDLQAINRHLQEKGRVQGVYLATDGTTEALEARLRQFPRVAGSVSGNRLITGFRETMAEMIIVFTLINSLLAGVIAFGVIYNSARLALAERQRELASLRVLGYTRAEVAWILNGELLLLALLALPVGLAAGYAMCWFIATELVSELYSIPLVLNLSTYLYAALIAALALLASLAIVRRQTFRLDLIAVLKTRE